MHPQSSTTLFFLHALAGSARSWDELVRRLEPDFTCVVLEMPGFGGSAHLPPASVLETVDWVAAEVRRRSPGRWGLVGHSMGGKIATLLAARSAGRIEGLAGVVLLAGSPLSPEPMDEDRRDEMLGWFADGPPDRRHAERFVEANTAGSLPPSLREIAVADVLRTSPDAWRSWLTVGSREDHDVDQAAIDVPVLVVAGEHDGDLGADNQRRFNATRFSSARVEVVAGAAHLLPLEAPDAVAALISRHFGATGGEPLHPAYEALLASDRVGARTRAILEARMRPAPAEGCLSAPQREVLGAVVAVVLPGVDGDGRVLASLEQSLTDAPGDGWRFDGMPPDREACRIGLDTLSRQAPGFPALSREEQEARLGAIAEGEVGEPGGDGLFDAGQMRKWFEDLRAACVAAWLSQPTAMARIGYDGFANGGDDAFQGYGRVGADDPEPWEPAPAGTARP